MTFSQKDNSFIDLYRLVCGAPTDEPYLWAASDQGFSRLPFDNLSFVGNIERACFY